jgi:L-amino acid N-acyltransferase YncA
MDRIIVASSDAELQAFGAFGGEPKDKPARLEGDQHLLALRDDEPHARCTLWWRATPMLDRHKVGFIGHFAVGADAPALSTDAVRLLLDDACRRLFEQGCALAVGPVDGSTWQRYRFVTERGLEPPFFLEPDNPDEWPGYVRDAGFAPLAHYTSAIDVDLGRLDPRAGELAKRMQSLEVRIRQFDPAHFAAEVDRMYHVSVKSFAAAFLYTPIDRTQCLAQYAPLERFIRPELVLIAEREDVPVGFAFAIPDWLQAQRGAAIDTAIIKTIAILPEPQYSGLGGLMLSMCRVRIAELGYARAIHALIHDGNVGSRRLSGRFGTTMRGYTLFARTLAPPP